MLAGVVWGSSGTLGCRANGDTLGSHKCIAGGAGRGRSFARSRRSPALTSSTCVSGVIGNAAAAHAESLSDWTEESGGLTANAIDKRLAFGACFDLRAATDTVYIFGFSRACYVCAGRINHQLAVHEAALTRGVCIPSVFVPRLSR